MKRSLQDSAEENLKKERKVKKSKHFETGEDEVTAIFTENEESKNSMPDLSHLSIRPRKIYEFAYSNLGYNVNTLAVNRMHAQFFDFALDDKIRSIFLTGLPGAGKSTVIKILRKYLIHIVSEALGKNQNSKDALSMKNSKKNSDWEIASRIVCTTATTGPAAEQIEGAMTLHSLFGAYNLNTGTFETLKDISETAIKNISPIQYLFIDEISMAHPIVFSNCDKIFRIVKNQPKKFFGGVKVILSGDFYQLKPVFNDQDPIRLTMKNPNLLPFVFDTREWEQEQKSGRMKFVILSQSYRQSSEDGEFLSLLDQVRRNSLLESGEHALRSRVKSFDQFFKEVVESLPYRGDSTSEKSNLDLTSIITPLFRKVDDVDDFNLKLLSKLDSPEYCYVSNFISSFKTMSEISGKLSLYQQDPNGLFDVRFGQRLSEIFKCLPHPIFLLNPSGIGPDLVSSSSTETDSTYANMAFYHDPSAMTGTLLASLAQKSKCLGRAKVVTRLRVGAKVCLTKNISVANNLINGSEGVVLGFMTVRRFMCLKGSKKLSGNFFVNNKYVEGVEIRKKKFESVILQEEEEDELLEYRILHGCLDGKTQKSNNAKHEKFPLVKFDHARLVMLVTPTLTEIKIQTANKARQEKERLNKEMVAASSSKHFYEKRESGNNLAEQKKIDSLNTAEHLQLLQTARSNIQRENEMMAPKNTLATYALYMPLTLSWARTIHSVQGSTLQYVYIGEENYMEENMFYVASSRVKRLEYIAWPKYPGHLIKTNQRINNFYQSIQTQMAFDEI